MTQQFDANRQAAKAEINTQIKAHTEQAEALNAAAEKARQSGDMAAYAALSEKAAAESQTAQNWQRGGLTGEDLPHGSKIGYLTGVIKSAAGAARDSQSSGFEYSAPVDAFSDNQWLRKDPYEITSKEELWGQYIFAVATATAGKGVPYLKGLHTDFKAGKINKAEFAQKVKQAQIDNNFYRDGNTQVNWSQGKPHSIDANLATHWNKHKNEFPTLSSAYDYTRYVENFIKTPPSGTLTKVRANGDTLYYHPGSNTFISIDKNNIPRTMFKPQKGIQYWRDQK